MAEDYYDRLGVSRDASTSEIKTAYRKKIKETHPDVSEAEGAHERTKQLIEAKDVLTDETERSRYDRLGHEAYVGVETSETTKTARGTSGGATTATTSGTASTSGAGTANGTASANGRGTARGANTTSGTASTSGETTSTHSTAHQESTRRATGGHHSGQNRSRRRQQQAQQSADWYRSGNTGDDEEEYDRAWKTNSAYAVGGGPGRFEFSELFNSQQTVVLLGTTFIIYPVLLFGALFPEFPTVVNALVAMCIILLIAFLQSIPQVGMLVFGIWTVLLPVLLFGFSSVSPFSIYGVLLFAAVLFPFGLSVLSWVAIRPMQR